MRKLQAAAVALAYATKQPRDSMHSKLVFDTGAHALFNKSRAET
jgi:hypothetical protein